MTASDWAALITAAVGVLGALAAWLKAQAASKTVQARVDKPQEPKS